MVYGRDSFVSLIEVFCFNHWTHQQKLQPCFGTYRIQMYIYSVLHFRMYVFRVCVCVRSSI